MACWLDEQDWLHWSIYVTHMGKKKKKKGWQKFKVFHNSVTLTVGQGHSNLYKTIKLSDISIIKKNLKASVHECPYASRFKRYFSQNHLRFSPLNIYHAIEVCMNNCSQVSLCKQAFELFFTESLEVLSLEFSVCNLEFVWAFQQTKGSVAPYISSILKEKSN